MLSVILLSAMGGFVFLGLVLRMGSLAVGGPNTSVTVSYKLSAGSPANLRPASNEISCASVLLCDTAVCILQVQLTVRMCGFPKRTTCT